MQDPIMDEAFGHLYGEYVLGRDGFNQLRKAVDYQDEV